MKMSFQASLAKHRQAAYLPGPIIRRTLYLKCDGNTAHCDISLPHLPESQPQGALSESCALGARLRGPRTSKHTGNDHDEKHPSEKHVPPGKTSAVFRVEAAVRPRLFSSSGPAPWSVCVSFESSRDYFLGRTHARPCRCRDMKYSHPSLGIGPA